MIECRTGSWIVVEDCPDTLEYKFCQRPFFGEADNAEVDCQNSPWVALVEQVVKIVEG